MNNFEHLQEMVTIMFHIVPEDASLEQILEATQALIAEQQELMPHKRKTLEFEDLN